MGSSVQRVTQELALLCLKIALAFENKSVNLRKWRTVFESESKDRDLIAEDDDERTFVLDLSSVLSRQAIC